MSRPAPDTDRLRSRRLLTAATTGWASLRRPRMTSSRTPSNAGMSAGSAPLHVRDAAGGRGPDEKPRRRQSGLPQRGRRCPGVRRARPSAAASRRTPSIRSGGSASPRGSRTGSTRTKSELTDSTSVARRPSTSSASWDCWATARRCRTPLTCWISCSGRPATAPGLVEHEVALLERHPGRNRADRAADASSCSARCPPAEQMSGWFSDASNVGANGPARPAPRRPEVPPARCR